MILHGKYIQGIGRAHRFGDVYRPAFGCPMVATFNVRADDPITGAKPTKMMDLIWPDEAPKSVTFWLCQINGHWAWAMRWEGTRLPETRIEFISKRPLPEELKAEPLTIEVFERWLDSEIQKWARARYQWQGFSWLPRQRVDSRSIWETIEPHADWSGANVIDVGSHYGYHSFQASKAGSAVIAVEPDDKVRVCGEIIARHIEMQDVQFQSTVPPLKHSDITLYLSVHHQWDPGYEKLAEKIAELVKHTEAVLFVEVILPPLFGKTYSPGQVDEMVGGQILATYKHQLRGNRRIYRVEGKG